MHKPMRHAPACICAARIAGDAARLPSTKGPLSRARFARPCTPTPTPTPPFRRYRDTARNESMQPKLRARRVGRELASCESDLPVRCVKHVCVCECDCPAGERRLRCCATVLSHGHTATPACATPLPIPRLCRLQNAAPHGPPSSITPSVPCIPTPLPHTPAAARPIVVVALHPFPPCIHPFPASFPSLHPSLPCILSFPASFPSLHPSLPCISPPSAPLQRLLLHFRGGRRDQLQPVEGAHHG